MHGGCGTADISSRTHHERVYSLRPLSRPFAGGIGMRTPLSIPRCLWMRCAPFRITPGEVVIDGYHVNPVAGQGVQVDREGRDQGLALSRLHLCNPPFV